MLEVVVWGEYKVCISIENGVQLRALIVFERLIEHLLTIDP
jgi:hypothetical protein